MTGRDLIVYILKNNLEDAPIFENGKFIGFISEEEAAVKFHVGVETIKTWVNLDMLAGIKVHNRVYIFADAKLGYGATDKIDPYAFV